MGEAQHGRRAASFRVGGDAGKGRTLQEGIRWPFARNAGRMVTAKIRAVPSDKDVEEALLASILVDDDAIFKVQPQLEPQDFYRDTNRFIYEACLELADSGAAINQVTVAHELGRKDRLEDAGGPAFLSKIVAELPTPIGVEHYSRVVKRDSIYRNLIGIKEQIKDMAYEGGPKLDAVLDRAQELIM